MSILDMVKGALASSDSTYGQLASHAIDLLHDNPHGGLEGLLQQLAQSGLGDQVKSWVGTGANLPVDPSQLESALGSDQISRMAQKAGISSQEMAGGLASILPQLVDKLSPGGALPQGDALSQALGMLRGRG
jgi:uncharacterized protein YidB (DUF937 family)